MALNCTGRIQISTNVTEVVTLGLASGTFPVDDSYLVNFAAGAGANAIDEEFTRSATLAISTPVTLTLSALTDDLGRTIAFTKVREFYLRNNGTAVLTIGGAATNPWAAIVGDGATDKIKIQPGGVLVLVAPDVNGYAVAAASSDQLKLDPGATACPYKLVIKGT